MGLLGACGHWVLSVWPVGRWVRPHGGSFGWGMVGGGVLASGLGVLVLEEIFCGAFSWLAPCLGWVLASLGPAWGHS